MDFEKFVSLISSKRLFFCRADKFEDPFEGSYSKKNLVLRPEVYEGKIDKKHLEEIALLNEWEKEWTYISCWHANNHESAAMWRLYTLSSAAVVVETSYANLKRCLSENCYLGLVKYIDYENDWLPEGNIFYPFMHKRKSFEHEKEVRAVISESATAGKNILGNKNSISGKSVPIDLEQLIECIHVSPTSPNWFFELVQEVSKKYELKVRIVKSDLYGKPVY